MLTSASLGALIFAFVYAAVREMSIFGKYTQLAVACCVSLLCIVSLCQLFVTGQGSGGTQNQPASKIVNPPAEEATEKDDEQNIWIPVLLLPYSALALTLLLLPLLLLLAAFRKGRRWQQIVHACRKLTTGNPDLEKKDSIKLNSDRLLRRPRNGKAEVKSARKNIHV